MSITLIAISILACLALAAAELATLLELALIPPPTPETRGPQGSLDLALGLLAMLGGVLGLLLAVTSGVFAMTLAGARRASKWFIAIVAAGVIAVLALMVVAFNALSLPRNPVHPFVTFIVIPVVALAYGLVTRSVLAPASTPSPEAKPPS